MNNKFWQIAGYVTGLLLSLVIIEFVIMLNSALYQIVR